MNKYVVVMQNNLKKSSSSFFTLFVKILTGVFIGMTFSLIGQQVFGYGNFAFTFVIVMCTTVFLMIAKKWGLMAVGLFNLFCILLGLLLRMYALMAPGA